jgi:hypothetical protein
MVRVGLDLLQRVSLVAFSALRTGATAVLFVRLECRKYDPRPVSAAVGRY